ncbi:uncharacterized protein LOC134230557 [Saccostrea cucullata]|uniref:uncharacterized protein LOC134230557 n=1 Tax=Saccostrea cuccullata TaxID=36930 RepID=UPI002ED126F5
MTSNSIHPESVVTKFYRCDETKSLDSSISQQSIRSIHEVLFQKRSSYSSSRGIANHWKMIMIILIPVLSLMSLATNSLLEAAKVKRASLESIHDVKVAHLYANLIQMLQRERGISSNFLSTYGDKNPLYDTMMTARKNTDQAFNKIPPNHDAIYMNGILHTILEVHENINLSRRKIENGSDSLEDHLNFYTEINNGLMSVMFDDIYLSEEKNCVLDIVAFTSLVRWTDIIGLLRARIASQYATCDFTSESLQNYMLLSGEAMGYKNIFTHYSLEIETAFSMENQSTEKYLENVRRFAWSKSFLNSCKTKSKAERLSLSVIYFQNMTKLIDFAFETQQLQSKVLTRKLFEIRKDAEFHFNVYLTVLVIITFVSIILTVWYILCIENMTFKIANNAIIIRAKSQELAEEKMVTEKLQYQMLPTKIATALKEARTIISENFEDVTIFISDIVNFTELGTRSSAREIFDLLNNLYGLFDNMTKTYEVLKIETMGDSYMVASGVPDRIGKAHASKICSFALAIHNVMKGFCVPKTFKSRESIQIRVGIHSGMIFIVKYNLLAHSLFL